MLPADTQGEHAPSWAGDRLGTPWASQGQKGCWPASLPRAGAPVAGADTPTPQGEGCLPSCLMPSLSSMRSCTRGMSMCSRGPCGGPFTGVSKLRLFLL